MQELQQKRERAVLAGLSAASMEPAERSTEQSMDELAALADTAGADTVAMILQTRQSVEPRTFLGAGKVQQTEDGFLILMDAGSYDPERGLCLCDAPGMDIFI